MDRLKAIATFLRCVDLGSVSAAARDLGISQPTVSKAIAALEAQLGGPLFVRSALGLTLTGPATRFVEHCRTVVRAMGDAEQAFSNQRREVSGAVRIAASPAFARALLVAHLPVFMQRYPDVTVDLRVDDRFVDLAEAGIDVAFRVAALEDSRLWRRGLGLAARALVAAPGYLAARRPCCTHASWRSTNASSSATSARDEPGASGKATNVARWPLTAAFRPTHRNRFCRARRPGWRSRCCRSGWWPMTWRAAA